MIRPTLIASAGCAHRRSVGDPRRGRSPVADFYRGSTIQMVIGVSAGGDYDLRARLLARYCPNTFRAIRRSSRRTCWAPAASWPRTGSPMSRRKDGTVLLAISSNLPVGQAVGLDGVKYDIRKFSYIGNTTDSPNVINSWHTTGVTRIEQVMEKELVVGATGRSSGSYYYPAALNACAGTKFKIVFGYPGGADVNIAMERGEVGGRGSNLWASWKSTRPQWLTEKKIHMLVQIALKRHPELPDVPLMQELVKDELHKQVMTFMSADTAIARSIVTTPDVPPDRRRGAAAGVRCRHEGPGAAQGSRAGAAGHQPDHRRRSAGDRQLHRQRAARR